MSIRMRTVAQVYCDGAVHQGLELSTQAELPLSQIKAQIRSAGWRITRDGRTLCPLHPNG